MNTQYFDALTKLIPLPNNPNFSTGKFSWSELEAAFGFPLPQDYKLLVEAYGYGRFADYLGLYPPFEHESPDSFVKTVSMFSRRLHSSREKFPALTLPFDLYPYGSLVVLGFTEDMGLISWKGNNDSDLIVVTDADFSPNYGEYSMSLSQFIYQWVVSSFTPYDFDNAREILNKATFIQL